MRDLFKVESEEHLQHLNDGLLKLEKSPADAGTLEEVFREAHSLKGAARMLGLSQIESLSHRLEDVFGLARKGETILTPKTIDVLCKDLDNIKKLVAEAIAGEPVIEKTPELDPAEPAARETRIEEFRIETIRVETRKLDRLMTEIGELKVLLNQLRHAAGEDISKLDLVADALDDGIRSIRLLPLSTIFSLFPRMARDLAREKSKEAELTIEGGETTADKRIIEELKDPLMHLVRNAIDHGIELPPERKKAGKPRQGSVLLKAYQTATNIMIEIKDDGRGLDLETIRRVALKQKICREDELAAMSPAQIHALIFVSGFSTSAFVSDVSGRGVGLDVVRANVERLKGTIQIESTAGKGTLFRLRLPITLATARVLIAAVSGLKVAVPVEHVQTTRLLTRQEIFTVEGREAIMHDEKPVSVVWTADILELKTMKSEHGTQGEKIPCVILSLGDEKLGLLIDALLDEQEIVLKPQSPLLRRVRNVSGAAILGSGEVCAILNPQDMIASARKKHFPSPAEKKTEERKRKTVLLVDDSITTRAQLKRILEGAGYEVEQAIDGVDAYNKLGGRHFDALVADILMPNMDGLTLTSKVRKEEKYCELPIILVTSLSSDEDKKRGIDAGANAYITKPAFDQKVFIDTLRRLI